MSTGPVERKVKAGTVGAGLGTAIAGALVWLLDTRVFTDGGTPEEVQTLVYALTLAALSMAGSFVAGYQARHTPRADRDAQVAVLVDEADEEARRARHGRRHRP